MAFKEVDLLAEAIAGTEKEIFGEAIDEAAPAESDQDRSLEQMGEGLEGEHEPELQAEGEGEEADAEGEETVEAEGDGRLRDEHGRFIKQSAQAEEQPQQQEEPQQEQPQQTEGRPRDDGRVPRTVALDERARRQVAESERDAIRSQFDQSQQELRALNARLDAFATAMMQQQQRAQQPPPPPAPEPKPVPDIFQDPEGYFQHVKDEFNGQLALRDQRMEHMRVQSSLEVAQARYGEGFTKAYATLEQAVQANPAYKQVAADVYRSGNPGEYLMNWHRQTEVLREAGSSGLDGLREKIAKEERERILKDPEVRRFLIEQLRADAGGGGEPARGQGRPNTVTRLPRSLNGTSGARVARADDSGAFDDSEDAVFSFAMR